MTRDHDIADVLWHRTRGILDAKAVSAVTVEEAHAARKEIDRLRAEVADQRHYREDLRNALARFAAEATKLVEQHRPKPKE